MTIMLSASSADLAEEQDSLLQTKSLHVDVEGSSDEVFCTTNEKGPAKGVDCLTSFRFGGQVRNTCIWDGMQPGDTQPWCATGVNIDGGDWGFCDCDCPSEAHPLGESCEGAETIPTTPAPDGEAACTAWD